MASQPLRQKDVARAAGLSPATISRALNNDLRLPLETRQRVQALANSMGYRADPLLSALASYRRHGHSGRELPGMAYLRRASVPAHPYHADLLRGAKEFAARYGYTVDYITYERVDDPALGRVLLNRGILGLLIEPIVPEDAALRIDLTRFAVVVVDKPFFSRDFDRVAFDNFEEGRQAFEQCFRHGHVRPGLLLSTLADRNGENKVKGGYLTSALERGVSPPVLPLILDEWDERRFCEWAVTGKIDAVITSQAFLEKVKAALRKMNLRIPEQIGLLNTNLQEFPPNASGIHHFNEGIGAFAAELLINKLARHDYGPSPHPHVVSQQGRWFDAATLRPLTAGGAPPAERKSAASQAKSGARRASS